jgi:hypothetical protein
MKLFLIMFKDKTTTKFRHCSKLNLENLVYYLKYLKKYGIKRKMTNFKFYSCVGDKSEKEIKMLFTVI